MFWWESQMLSKNQQDHPSRRILFQQKRMDDISSFRILVAQIRLPFNITKPKNRLVCRHCTIASKATFQKT